MIRLLDAVSEAHPSFWHSGWTRRPWLGHGLLEVNDLARELMHGFEENVALAAADDDDEVSGDGGRFWFVRRVERYYDTVSESVEAIKSQLGWRRVDASIIRNTTASTTGAHFDNAHTFIVQLDGTKRLRIWPPDDISPAARHARLTGVADVAATALPSDPAQIVDVTLRPGDVAYVPVFWGHRADTGGEATTLSFGVRMEPGVAAPMPVHRPQEVQGCSDDAPVPSGTGLLVPEPSVLMKVISGRIASDIELLIRRITNLGPALGVDTRQLMESWERAEPRWSQLAPSAELVEAVGRALPQVRAGRWGSLDRAITDVASALDELGPHRSGFDVVVAAGVDVAAAPEEVAAVHAGLRTLADRHPAVLVDTAQFVERVVVSDDPAVLAAAGRRFRSLAIPHRSLGEPEVLAAYWAAGLGELSVRLRLWGRHLMLAGDPAWPAGTSSSDLAVLQARREAIELLLTIRAETVEEREVQRDAPLL